jgi:PAS domain S-box-containing protein
MPTLFQKTSMTIQIFAAIMAVTCILLVLKLFIERRRTRRNQIIVEEFAGKLFGNDSVEDILWGLAQSCISKLGFEDCVVYLLNKKSGVLIQKAAFGPKNPHGQVIKNPMNIPIGYGIVGSVAVSGVAEIIPDTKREHRYIPDDTINASEICVPIISKGEIIGVIDSEHSKKGFYTKDHLQMLMTLASLCGARIAQAEAVEKTKVYASRLDALIELIPDFIVLTTPEGNRKFVNDSYCKFTGKTSKELIEENFFKSLPIKERENYMNSLKELSPKSPTMTNVHMNMGAGNRAQWTLWNETAVFREDGTIQEVISVGRNINALHQSQNLRENYIHTLEEILQKTSHQVRQPLAQILGIVEIMGIEPNTDTEEMFEYLRRSARQLDLVTRELNDYIYDNSLM